MHQVEQQAPPHQPAIVIACGGEGSRIGGGKPLRKLGGITLIERACEWAQQRSDHVALALRDAAQLSASDLPLLADRHPGLGPISALENAFEFAHAAGRELVLVIGCDQPFLPGDLVTRLTAAIGKQGATMPLCRGREQPLAALWRAQPARIAAYIADGGRSLRGFADSAGVEVVEWEAEAGCDPFFNVNSPDDLAEAERRIAASAP